MTLLHRARVLVRPRYRSNWVRGRYRADGFAWFVRGTNFPPSHEDWLRALITPFSGELFVDVGAHMGTWAVRATKSFDRVVAFEPQPELNRMLRINVAMNKLRNISVFQAALSNFESEIVSFSKEMKSKVRVPIRTLDSFGLKPTIIKIDTEGNELPVLQGASDTLEGKPRLIVENHSFSKSSSNVRGYLESRGYSVKELRRLNRFSQVQSWLVCN
jgi:FkbM family methyltransferase